MVKYHNIDPALQHLIQQYQPADISAGCFLPLTSESGLSGKVMTDQHCWLARRIPAEPLPFVNRQREYRLLRKLRHIRQAPRGLALNRQWLLLSWQAGHILSQPAFMARMPEWIALLSQVHHQPLSGYRLTLFPLLESYWQRCRYKNLHWQRALRKLQQQKEPAPLRLALLHMDVHPGNIVDNQGELSLIDWEYAADGDIALELTAIIGLNQLNEQQTRTLLQEYADHNQLSVRTLARQVRRWQPWTRLLAACWYQLRAELADNEAMYAIANKLWHHLK